jgi:hypothetical protein
MFPGSFQPFGSIHSPVALCATFEQTWQPSGYTRGELVGSLSLAPGERLTLEVHSWDKSTRKSEDELSTEQEMRTSEKLTQRDALTVAQEYSKQRNSNVSASGTVPIPKMPLSVSGQVSTQTSESLRRTRETLREQTAEASNTLKINRKTRLEVSRETGREEKQTRVLENTNRCHSLNCHYFEVVANYVVTTRLVSVRPCVLLRNPRPSFTRDWVLCHTGTLIEALLDRTFLPGFEGARALKVYDVIAEIERNARLAELERLGDQLTPHVTAILDAYRALNGANDETVAAVQSCGGGWVLLCVLDKITPLTWERVVAWFALSSTTRTALKRLATDIASGRNAAEALRTLLLVAGPEALTQTPGEAAVEQALRELLRVDSLNLKKDLLSFDDAGLRAAIGAAAGLVRTLPPQAPMEPAIPNEALANARVEFERLQCHLDENWLHYSQAVWLREDHGQRLMRLQSYGAIASVIENELLGFYGDRAAYPLRDVSTIAEVNLADVIGEADKEVRGAKDAPFLISMPTPGLLLEAIVGDCNACEDFIERSRLLDLRQQEAKARQEEAEADRRAQRLAAVPPDLSDPSPHPASEIRVVLEPGGAGDSGGSG